jgi:excisionase family DNA binding protein
MKTKKEAAEYLGISTRQLENYAKQGKLSVCYGRGPTGDQAVYDEKELRKLRAELDTRRAPRPAVVSESDESPEQEPRSLARLSDVAPLAFLQQIAATIREGQKAPASASVGEKIMLTLADASALTSLSKGFLTDAIHEKKLRAQKLGRGWKIKRTDLDAFVKKL